MKSLPRQTIIRVLHNLARVGATGSGEMVMESGDETAVVTLHIFGPNRADRRATAKALADDLLVLSSFIDNEEEEEEEEEGDGRKEATA